MKRIEFILSLGFLVMILAACSAESQVLPTPMLPTDTPLPTPTLRPSASPSPLPTSTYTPTPTPTPTQTSTPEPVLNPQAMINWQDLKLPKDYIAYPPSAMGIESGAFGWSTSSGEVVIEQSFLFSNPENTDLIYGYTLNLPGQRYIEGIDDVLANFVEFAQNSTTKQDTEIRPIICNLGDRCAGVWMTYTENGIQWRRDWLEYRIGNIVVNVFNLHHQMDEPVLPLADVARVYAESLQNVEPACYLVEVTQVQDAEIPTFEIVADGFYPNERRMILLTSEEPYKGSFGKLGQGADAVRIDENGRLEDTVSASFGEVELPEEIEFELTIIGVGSGCEIVETVIWRNE